MITSRRSRSTGRTGSTPPTTWPAPNSAWRGRASARTPNIRVAIITGAGDRAFCAGQDIRATAEGGIRNKVPGSRVHHNVWKPVICALNGMVVGGALHQVADADLIIAAEHAELIDTHLRGW